jgi:hypothetical protein
MTNIFRNIIALAPVVIAGVPEVARFFVEQDLLGTRKKEAELIHYILLERIKYFYADKTTADNYQEDFIWLQSFLDETLNIRGAYGTSYGEIASKMAELNNSIFELQTQITLLKYLISSLCSHRDTLDSNDTRIKNIYSIWERNFADKKDLLNKTLESKQASKTVMYQVSITMPEERKKFFIQRLIKNIAIESREDALALLFVFDDLLDFGSATYNCIDNFFKKENK